MFSRDEMQRAIEDALKSMEGIALELYRRGREEAREELETVTRERDEARAEVERLKHALADATNETTRVRLQTKREVEALTDERDELLVRVANQDAELRATRESYNEARTDVPALIARVRELEAELDELWTRYKKLDEEDDNLREALAGAMDRW